MNAVSTQGIRLLVVDDDRLVLSSIAEGLEQAGYAVLKADSGTEAVRIAAEQSPDLVVMDVRMPGMSGVEAARIIREQAGIAVLFLSAYDDEAMVKGAVAEGGLGYLVKPVKPNQLAASIEAALARAADIKGLRSAEANLNAALKSDRNVGVAMGLVMERYRVTRVAAFEALRSRARSQRRKLGEVAAEIVDSAEALNALDIRQSGEAAQARERTR
jgi:response regulator NasT